MQKIWFWPIILGVSSIVLAGIMQGPQILHQNHPDSRGITVQLNSDEFVYMARVQEALSGRPEQSAEAFVGKSGLVGTQFALIERVYGTIFSWTKLRAPEVLQILDSVIPVLIFLSIFWFLQLTGFTRPLALVGAVIFVVLELYSLSRPIHMRSSFLLMLLSLIGILYASRQQWIFGLIGGLFLGILVGVYFWSWSFAWAWWGIFLVWEYVEWTYTLRHEHFTFLQHLEQSVSHLFRRVKERVVPWQSLAIIGGVGLFAASPFIMDLVSLTKHPLYEYGSFRSGMRPSHLPESWVYSTLFLIMVLGVLMHTSKKYEEMRPYRGAVVTLLAAFVFMNQQIVHGIVFNFVSHSIFSLLLAALCVVLLAYHFRTRWLLLAGFAACVYMAAIGYDGRYVLGQWKTPQGRFDYQHLSTLLPALDALPRARILSDPETSAFIAGSTKHDIVYSIYLKNVLMTHEEIAERFCLTQLPVLPEDRNISSRVHLVYPDANGAFGEDVRIEEVLMTEDACARLDSDPSGAIARYDVSHVLWNTKMHPDWKLSRLNLPLERITVGDGWELLSVE